MRERVDIVSQNSFLAVPSRSRTIARVLDLLIYSMSPALFVSIDDTSAHLVWIGAEILTWVVFVDRYRES